MADSPKSKNGKKNGQKSTAPVGALVPQAHGGALRNGGTNRGGPGRPDLAVRERCRTSFAKRIATLEQIADGTLKQRIEIGRGDAKVPAEVEPDIDQRISAIDKLAKYGLPQQVEHQGGITVIVKAVRE